jgi:hypothetical protein
MGTPRWTREKIITALVADALRLGRPPTEREWHRRDGRHWRPTAETVKARFGSWADGLRAAGLEARAPGGQERERCQRGHDEWRTRPDGKRFCAACRREKQRRMREDARKWRRRLARQRPA